MEILQKILMPDPQICMNDNMYFRMNSKNKSIVYNVDKKEYVLQEGDFLEGNTYFNCFSSPKWSKYTEIERFKVILELRGKFKITLCKSFLDEDTIITNKVKELYHESDEIEEFELEYDYSLDQFKGIYYIRIEAIKNNSCFLGGGYYTEYKPINKIKIGIVICTFKREKYIKRNLNLFKKWLEQKSIFKDKIEVYIVDNAKSLDKKEFQTEYLHLIPNKNLGGAGGFTRGMIEVLQRKEEFSHILLMDDDALVDINSIERTFCFLQYVKKECCNLFIGGSTLRLDKQNIQLESAAVWNNNILYNLKSNLDLENEEDILFNDLEESKSYGAWVFNCIPLSQIDEKNLPLPLFVRGDDMEYGIRNSENLLTMNGICAWHAPLHNKYSAFMLYYTLRNQLILNALYDENFSVNAAISLLTNNIARELFLYRYENIQLIFKAYEDFLKGVSFFENTDAELNHKELMRYAPKYKSFNELSRTKYPFIYLKLHHSFKQLKWKRKDKILRIFRVITFNGYFIPKLFFRGNNNYNIVDLCKAKPVNFFLYRKVLQVDLDGTRGYITEINKKEFFKTLNRFFKLSISMKCGAYRKAIKSYKEEIYKINNIQFWKKYLNIE